MNIFSHFRCSITNYAKHHAISYSLMQSMGGPEHFYEQFKNLDYEAFYQAGPQKMMNKAMEESISRNIEILEVNLLNNESSLDFVHI